MADLKHKFKYFAYGSNLHPVHFKARCPSAEFLAVARLTGHALRFTKPGKDGSAKCDIQETEWDDDIVYGVVYRISAEDKAALDKAEGGYGTKKVALTDVETGRKISAYAYYALKADPSLYPHHWYKALVADGARYNSLPEDYIDKIENVKSCHDPDEQRTAKFNAILAALRPHPSSPASGGGGVLKFPPPQAGEG